MYMNWATLTIIIFFTIATVLNLLGHGLEVKYTHSFWKASIKWVALLWLIYKSGGLQ